MSWAHGAQKGEPETVLLVEDELLVCEVMAEVLKGAGYRVAMKHDAEAALEACRKSLDTFNLLLADVILPGMSGFDLVGEFRILCPRAAVLLMTGYPEQIARLPLSAPSNCLAKPFSMQTLLKKVRATLDRNLLDIHPGA